MQYDWVLVCWLDETNNLSFLGGIFITKHLKSEQYQNIYHEVIEMSLPCYAGRQCYK